jgi:bifunctional DNase/RNase
MFGRNSFKGTNGAAFLADLILLASVVGIPIWILKQLLKKRG